MIRKSFTIKGVVQGVGFRPFIYKTAIKSDLNGFVKNDQSGVCIEVEGKIENIKLFEKYIMSDLPPLAKIDDIKVDTLKILGSKQFEILESSLAISAKTAAVLADIAICKDCLEDIYNQDAAKYYKYFATNCTNCGPRYSIIKTIPYDRVNTSMDKFQMCESCEKEYRDPLNRRYHAQPISCNNCGPTLCLYDKNRKIDIENKQIFKIAAKYIKNGKILAIKGLGGFHIVCDATNDNVVVNLRKYKNRPNKPFAVMCKDIEQVKQIAKFNDLEEQILKSKESPIVVLKKRYTDNISDKVAVDIDKIGVFLPYTALQHILFENLDNPIVATSANLADEPIIVDYQSIFQKLPFIDFIVDFDRDIVNAVDDSLVQVINGKVQTLRLARGYGPKIIKLPFKIDKKILAVGANSKNSIALAFEDKIILSPHIGDLESLKAFEYFERTIETFKRFYDFEPDIIIHDKHPNYETTKWAKLQKKELFEVQHHLAHIYACKAEFGSTNDCLGFSFDGSGYGGDGTVWGGEVFVGDERIYHFKPIKLIGSQKAVKEPRRVALSMLFEKLSLDEVLKLDLKLIRSFSTQELKLLYKSFTNDLNTPLSSSVGRLFDAVASFCDVVQTISYEGESGLKCEKYYDNNIVKSFEYNIENAVIDIKLVEFVLNNRFTKQEINTMFINTLVKIIVDISKKHNIDVILSGGVFQNKTLLELVCNMLDKEGTRYYYQQKTAINDGGIALGQIYYHLLNK